MTEAQDRSRAAVPPEHRRRWLIWTLATVLLAVAAVVGGPWLYLTVFRPDTPEPLALSSASPTAEPDQATPTGPLDVDGTWQAAEGSQAGYRLAEVLSGKEVDAVGRTDLVTATVEISAGVMTTALVVVDTGSIATEESARDAYFRRALDTSTFPEASFTLTEPLDVSALATAVQAVHLDAVGTLTFHGVSQPVTASLDVQRTAAGVEVVGSVPVVLEDYGLSAPELGFVTVEPQGTVEMLLQLTR